MLETAGSRVIQRTVVVDFQMDVLNGSRPQASICLEGEKRYESILSQMDWRNGSGGSVHRRMHRRRHGHSSTGIAQHKPRDGYSGGIERAVYGDRLLECGANYGNPNSRQLGCVHHGFCSDQRRDSFDERAGNMLKRSEGDLHGVRVGSAVWLYGTRMYRDHRVRRRVRPGCRDGTADVPMIPATALAES